MLVNGIGNKMIKVIKSMYTDCLSSIKINNQYTSFFTIERGVRQGDSLSPTIDRGVRQGDSLSPSLFNLYINDICDLFEMDDTSPLILESTKLGSLLFADDLLLVSESKEGLQNSLNKLSDYCDKWQLPVNCTKTKAMVISKNNIKKMSIFIIKNLILKW